MRSISLSCGSVGGTCGLEGGGGGQMEGADPIDHHCSVPYSAPSGHLIQTHCHVTHWLCHVTHWVGE